MKFSGKSVAEATEKGLKYFSLNSDEVEVKVIKEAVKGLFGKVKEEAEIEMSVKLQGAKRAVNFLDGLFSIMDIPAKADVKEDGDSIVIEVITTNSSSVIGYRGEVLDAIQNLAGAVANIGNKEYKRVVVDCENYRAKREETLISLANKLADKAVRTGRDVSIEPMNPYERRVIHSALASSDKVTTKSDGKEPFRHVVIVPNEKKFREKKPYNKKKDFKKGDKKDFAKKEAPKKSFSFGTYLGNSLKDSENK